MANTVSDWLSKQKPDKNMAHKVISEVMGKGKPKSLKIKVKFDTKGKK